MHIGDGGLDLEAGGGGDGGRPSDVERRLTGVESRLNGFESRLNELSKITFSSSEAIKSMRTELGDFRLESTKMFGTVGSTLSEIKGLLEGKASVAEVSNLRGSIASLPTVWQLITLVFGILAGVFAIVKFGTHG